MSGFRPRHLSVSAVQLYAKCPAQFRQRYVDKLVSPTNPPLMFGKVFHAALEAEHKGENAERALIQAWNAADADLASSGQQLSPDKVHALALLGAYQAGGYGGRMGIPERMFKLPFPSPTIPVPVLGYIDLMLPEQRRLREYKTTSGTSWTETKVALEHQLHVYGWVYQRLFHHRVQCAEYMIFSTITPTFYVIEAEPSPDGFRLFQTVAEGVWNGIVNERYDGCGVCPELCKPPTAKPANGPSFDWSE